MSAPIPTREDLIRRGALRATYAKAGLCWRGAIKVHDRTVWTCQHMHYNRDQSTRTNGTAAQHCAEAEVVRQWVACFVFGLVSFVAWAVNAAGGES